MMPETMRDWQRALYIPLTVLAWLAVVVVVLWLLSHITKTILTLVLSGIVAFALTPLVRFFSRYMPRGIAIGLAYLLGFTVIFGFISLLVVNAAEQVTNLVGDLPAYSNKAQRLEPQIVSILHPFGVTATSYESAQKQAIGQVQTVGKGVASQSVDIITSILGTIVDVILVLILSIYLTADGENLTRWLRSQTAGRQRRNVSIFFAIVNQVVGGYIRGTLTMAALIGFLVGAGMLVLRIKYAVLLGILAFFMEFVPVVGVLISGGLCVLVALFQGWIWGLIVLGYFVVVHIIEGDVVGPRIMGKAVGIHPATALVAFVAGSELFGVWGALFASPLAGLLQAIGTAVWREMHGGDAAEVLQTAVDLSEEHAAAEAQQDVAAEQQSDETLKGAGSIPAGE